MSPRTRTKDVPGRLKAVYDFIVRYKAANDGCFPTMATIGMNVIGTPATSLVSFYLDKLIAQGKLQRRGNTIITGGTWTALEKTQDVNCEYTAPSYYPKIKKTQHG